MLHWACEDEEHSGTEEEKKQDSSSGFEEMEVPATSKIL